VGNLVFAYAQAVVPKVTVVVGKAIGSGYNAMGSKNIGADIVYAWQDAQIAALDSDTGATITYKQEIADSENPVAARAEYAAKYAEENSSTLVAAQLGYVDDIIAPADTRIAVAAALEILAGKREDSLPKKHGNAPV